MLAFFVLLGATNLAKGLYFGTVLIAVPVTLFILGQRAWSPIRRWLWVWGLVAFGLTAVSWAVAAYLRRPDIVDLWASDYLGRLNQGYMKESRFYYLIHLPWILFPWSLAAIVGMVRAFRAEANSFDRFLVCWAIGDLLILSVPQGKHHHYYLHAVAPWAVLAVDGFRAIWAKLMPTAWPVRKGLIAAVVIAVVGHVASQSYETFTNAYRYDREFAERVSRRIRDGETIVVLKDALLPAGWDETAAQPELSARRIAALADGARGGERLVRDAAGRIWDGGPSRWQRTLPRPTRRRRMLGPVRCDPDADPQPRPRDDPNLRHAGDGAIAGAVFEEVMNLSEFIPQRSPRREPT
jgi:hypothetical protein